MRTGGKDSQNSNWTNHKRIKRVKNIEERKKKKKKRLQNVKLETAQHCPSNRNVEKIMPHSPLEVRKYGFPDASAEILQLDLDFTDA